MTADRTTAKMRRVPALLGAVGIVLGAAACSSSGDSGSGSGGGGKLSYDQVRSTAQGVAKSGPCPFGLDLAAALKGAGIDRPVTAGAKDEQPVDTDLGDGVPAQDWPAGASHPAGMPSMPATPPSAWVTCTYTVGSTPVRIDLLAIPQNDIAVNIMLPHIQRFGNVGVDQLTQFANDKPKAGETRLTPGDASVGVARVAAKGKGDLVLTLTQDADAAVEPSLVGEPLRKATEQLAAQLRP
ncbi:hypothetical protein ACGFZP_09735 [Kitasatospora sp. NPDC048239]|uniref:hypothetical protein n=1 Tax=Kitasatospora sp. NPDC048239 TaxID=3364046 RepID=UPI0037138ADF